MIGEQYFRRATNGSAPDGLSNWIVGGVGVVALVILSAATIAVGVNWKLLAISWTAFAAMAVGAPLGARAATSNHPLEPGWGYGLASGAMVTSAALFLIPQALGQHGQYGALGIAIGFLAGYVGHQVGHRLTHLQLPIDRMSAELTAHALSAGAIIGAIYRRTRRIPRGLTSGMKPTRSDTNH